jgi:hypothetical protein
LTALEEQSREFLKEREEKKRLEGMISEMESEMMVAGQNFDNSTIRQEYEEKLTELEVER